MFVILMDLAVVCIFFFILIVLYGWKIKKLFITFGSWRFMVYIFLLYLLEGLWLWSQWYLFIWIEFFIFNYLKIIILIIFKCIAVKLNSFRIKLTLCIQYNVKIIVIINLIILFFIIWSIGIAFVEFYFLHIINLIIWSNHKSINMILIFFKLIKIINYVYFNKIKNKKNNITKINFYIIKII